MTGAAQFTIPIPLPFSNPAGSVAKAAAGAVLDSLKDSVVDAGNWLIGHVLDLGMETTKVDLTAQWFQRELGLIRSELVLVVVPVLMAATIGPVLHQDLRRLWRVWGVGLPVAVLAGIAGAQFADWGLAATDRLCSLAVGPGSADITAQFGKAMTSNVISTAPVFVQLIVAALTVVGGILVWLELVLRSSAVYIATFFMPLALVGYVWPATAGMAKRAVEILVALILSKFVIVASLSLGLAALEASSPVEAPIAGAGILLLAGFAPFALLKLVPVVETSAIAHLEGLSRRPFQAASAAPGMIGGHPLTRLASSVLSRNGSGSASPLPQASVEARPASGHSSDWPLAGRVSSDI